MNRKLIIRLVLYFLLLVVIQIPLLHNWVLYDVAFPFPYIGFVLLLPHTLQRSWSLVIAFFLGLLIDVFSNTPGLHASVSVFVAFVRVPWLEITTDSSIDELDLTIPHLGLTKHTAFILPLIFIHHFLLFTLENEGLKWFGMLLSKVIGSTLFSYFLIWLVTLIVIPSGRRK
ncbi:MAG: hypothetical protein GY816_19715 [Cytophagales bacterium]|nr:hypothetical protein [Cytophagales bacterium]